MQARYVPFAIFHRVSGGSEKDYLSSDSPILSIPIFNDHVRKPQSSLSATCQESIGSHARVCLPVERESLYRFAELSRRDVMPVNEVALPHHPSNRPAGTRIQFGAGVVAMRRSRGLGQAQVARRAECSPAHLSNIEHERSAPPGESLAARLCAALELSEAQSRRFMRAAREALRAWRSRLREERATLRRAGHNAASADHVHGWQRDSEGIRQLSALGHRLNSDERGECPETSRPRLVAWSGYRLDEAGGQLHIGLDLPEVDDAELVIALTNGDLRLRVERRAATNTRSPPM